jgi:hypothetical protein
VPGFFFAVSRHGATGWLYDAQDNNGFDATLTMTQQIRKNVFETNSSSSHSLTLAKGDLVAQPFEKDVLRKGAVTLTLGDYNWEYYRYYSTLAKAGYLATQLFHRTGIPEGKPEEVTRALREQNPSFDMLCRVIWEHTGVRVLVKPGSSGGIDHESVGNGLQVFNSEDKLRKLLFSPNSYIQTGNDNEGPGKIIQTDRGPEHYYASRYRAPKKSHVTITLRAASSWSFRDMLTKNGAVISEEKQPELYKALRKRGTVVAVESKEFGYRDYDGGRGHLGYMMAKLKGSGWYFTEDMHASRQFTCVARGDDTEREDERLIQVSVPQELAEQVAALRAPRKSKAKAEADAAA